MDNATGWKCPHCGRAHGPHVDTCPTQIGGVSIDTRTSFEIKGEILEGPIAVDDRGAIWRTYEVGDVVVTSGAMSSPVTKEADE